MKTTIIIKSKRYRKSVINWNILFYNTLQFWTYQGQATKGNKEEDKSFEIFVLHEHLSIVPRIVPDPTCRRFQIAGEAATALIAKGTQAIIYVRLLLMDLNFHRWRRKTAGVIRREAIETRRVFYTRDAEVGVYRSGSVSGDFWTILADLVWLSITSAYDDDTCCKIRDKLQITIAKLSLH